jgi:hypothetical protein
MLFKIIASFDMLRQAQQPSSTTGTSKCGRGVCRSAHFEKTIPDYFARLPHIELTLSKNIGTKERKWTARNRVVVFFVRTPDGNANMMGFYMNCWGRLQLLFVRLAQLITYRP